MRGVKSFAMVLCVSISTFSLFLLITFLSKATSKEGKEGGIELIQPPADSKPGDRVYFEGEEFESQSFFACLKRHVQTTLLDAVPLPQLNPKKKIFETVQPGIYFNSFDTLLLTLKIGFITLESREAAWVNPVTNSVHKIRTKNGVCVAPTFIGASLS